MISELLYRRVLVNFRRTKTNFPAPKTIVPGKILEFYIAVREFWYILGEWKQIFLSLKPGSGELSPGKFLNSALL